MAIFPRVSIKKKNRQRECPLCNYKEDRFPTLLEKTTPSFLPSFLLSFLSPSKRIRRFKKAGPALILDALDSLEIISIFLVSGVRCLLFEIKSRFARSSTRIIIVEDRGCFPPSKVRIVNERREWIYFRGMKNWRTVLRFSFWSSWDFPF